MIETLSVKKTKICLSDYNYRKDIENRLVMARFSTQDLKILEEILYSPIKISLSALAEQTQTQEDELIALLNKLSKTGLLIVEADTITIDKEMRKYFEAHIQRYEEDFKPGMEFFQSLLKKVPIHILPTWYSIPRTSNNIFESIVEKHLQTPQLYQRYLTELSFPDPSTAKIMNMVFASDDLKVSAKEVLEELNLTKEQFEESTLLLEFSCVCCLSYENINGIWEEILTPFQEWKDYLLFLKETEVAPIQPISSIEKELPDDFSFVKDMGSLLQEVKKHPLPISSSAENRITLEEKKLQELALKAKLQAKDHAFIKAYFEKILSKLLMLKLIDISEGQLVASEASEYFLEMKLEARALYIYRHPLNKIFGLKALSQAALEKALRECEKSIVRILGKGWVFFDDFYKGVIAPLSEHCCVTLKKTGKSWRYTLPHYSTEEKQFIRECLLEWLFEVGIIAKGLYQGRECFTVTAFGASLFSR